MSSGLPRIAIEACPENDLCVILALLVPTGEVAELVRDPGAFLAGRRAELRFARDLLAAGQAAPPPPAPAAPAGDASRRAPGRAAARLRRDRSLLR